MRSLAITLILLLLAPPILAKTDIVIDPDYDPRIAMRVIVLPALKDRSLKRVNERTISAMLSTEMLRLYEVLDLTRFEFALTSQRLTLDNAFTATSRDIVRDIAGVDAVTSVEIYRWDGGSGGIPFITAKKGTIGVRMRMMDPYTGRLYWSVNRLEDVKPGSEFLDTMTGLFRDVIDELLAELEDIAEEYNEADSYADLQAKHEPWQRMQGYSRRTFGEGKDNVERGFMPVMTPEAAYIAAYRGYGYRPQDSQDSFSAPVSPDVGYEDMEDQHNFLLPPLQDPAVFDERVKAVVDSLLESAGLDSLRRDLGTLPELPPFEMPETSVDTTVTGN
ncbi:hypothetical protein BMS3Bbin04_01446 [bacterium BMS3Bbin04]|nr:hypothetical protein BMS3Bbin04_01446 [bacterium BMS3Bbin04]